jgi:hypothetical protein
MLSVILCLLLSASASKQSSSQLELSSPSFLQKATSKEYITDWITQSKGETIEDLLNGDANSDSLKIKKDQYGEYYADELPDHDDGTEIPEVVAIYQKQEEVSTQNYEEIDYGEAREETEEESENRAVAYIAAQAYDEDDEIQGVYESYDFSVSMPATEYEVDQDETQDFSQSNLRADFDTDETEEYTYTASSDEALYSEIETRTVPESLVFEDEDDVPVYNVMWTYDGMSGDLYDNEETDTTPLHIAIPNSKPSQSSWRNIEKDEDTDDFLRNLEDSDNPAVSVLIQVQEDGLASYNPNSSESEVQTNILDRDEDELPEDVDDGGDDMGDGDTIFILVTTFEQNAAGSGKLWVVPKDSDDRDEGYILISGLSTPTGACFDTNHDFLYVVDPGYDDIGYIFQYEIDWDDDGDKFELRNDQFAVIYKGERAYDCAVDKYGNLFFLVRESDQLNMVNYLDLWSGFKNMHYTIYEKSEKMRYIDSPTALDIYEDEEIYFVNSANATEAGVLVYAEAESNYLNDGEIKPMIREDWSAYGVAVSNDYAYFVTSDGTLFCFDLEDEDTLYVKTQGFFGKPIGLCYGDDKVYIADYERDRIYRVDDDDETEEPETFIKIPGPYNVHCVNSGLGLLLSSLLFILILF